MRICNRATNVSAELKQVRCPPPFVLPVSSTGRPARRGLKTNKVSNYSCKAVNMERKHAADVGQDIVKQFMRRMNKLALQGEHVNRIIFKFVQHFRTMQFFFSIPLVF